MAGSCYNEIVATEIAGCFLKLSAGRINYTKLIKLMYLVERYAIYHWGYSLTHDDLFWLKKGPILSRTLDLVRHDDETAGSYWSKHIEKRHYDVVLINDPKREHLSQAVIGAIKTMWTRFGDLSWQEIVDLLHEKLPERRHLTEGSDRIELNEIVKGKTGDASSRIVQEIKAFHCALSQLVAEPSS